MPSLLIQSGFRNDGRNHRTEDGKVGIKRHSTSRYHGSCGAGPRPGVFGVTCIQGVEVPQWTVMTGTIRPVSAARRNLKKADDEIGFDVDVQEADIRPLQLGSPGQDGEALWSCGSCGVDPTGLREERQALLVSGFGANCVVTASRLRSLGVSAASASKVGSSGNGPWRLASCPPGSPRFVDPVVPHSGTRVLGHQI
jgi:hypothetical protein